MLDRLDAGLRELDFLAQVARATSRRTFLQWSGVTLAVATVGCGDDDGGDVTTPTGNPVSPGASTANVPQTAATNVPVQVTVQAKDANGTDLLTGGSTVVARLTGANEQQIRVEDRANGKYVFSYTPTVEGTDTLEITIDGSPISGSPFTINVTTGPAQFGSGDIAVLNYAYALEQLESTFFTQVVENFYTGGSAEELQIFTDIRDHEVIHREFLKAALGDQAIPTLQFDFTSVDFTSRQNVLDTSLTFEDLGISAYNGAGFLLENPDFVTVAGKIVSVEARHSAVLALLQNPNSTAFANDNIVEPATGLDLYRTPNQVLPIADPFVTTEIDTSQLPTN
ncbi:MAG TPA: ferritin-like domain-containing protein [Gemmatimonadales bacterium]|nr:ferritin-like domain-containing protein [Gemmatimonadales bacterium]